MDLTITAIFYLLLGVGIATAVVLNSTASRADRWFQGIGALLFWPIFFPVLLRPSEAAGEADSAKAKQSATLDNSLEELVAQTEQDLAAALASLPMPLNGRLNELQSAWRLQVERIKEVDVLLATANGESDRTNHLREIRERLHHELIGTLNSARDLVLSIHTARFNDGAANRAAELLKQVAANIEPPKSGTGEVKGAAAN